MWSIAGITVARLGVKWEKKSVASLRIWHRDRLGRSHVTHRLTHLENIAKLLCNLSLLWWQPVFWYGSVACLFIITHNLLYHSLVLHSYLKHIICWISAGCHVTWQFLQLQLQFIENCIPSRKQDGWRVDDLEREFTELDRPFQWCVSFHRISVIPLLTQTLSEVPVPPIPPSLRLS